MNFWHIITPEFPPQSGGVADYALQVAEGLRKAGDAVDVWCPGPVNSSSGDPTWVHRELGSVGLSDLWRVGRKIEQRKGPRRLFVQWVPHGYGWRSMNLLFCCWLFLRAKAGDELDLMVHEPFLSFREGTFKQDLAALVHRVMAIVLLQAASRVWLSTLAWETPLRPFALGRKIAFECLPVPSNVPVCRSEDSIQKLRQEIHSPDVTILGHFSSYGLDIAALLLKILPPLLSSRASWVIQLMGRGSERFRDEMIEAYPALADQIIASGQLSSERLSTRLSACDVLLQPYPDGVTTRRTTLMATLEHGMPVVTTVGRLSEDFWVACNALSVVPADDTDQFVQRVEKLVGNRAELMRLGKAASAFYAAHFGLSKVVRDLREAGASSQS